MRMGLRNKAAALIGGTCISVALGLGAFAAAAPAPNTPQARVEAAYRAAGMTDEKLAPGEIVTLVVRGSSIAYDPGESESVADPLKPDWGTSTFTETWDRSRELHRIEWSRPRANGEKRNYTEILSANGGYVMGIDVNGAQPRRAVQANNMPIKTMAGLRLALELRELERDNILDLMHTNPDRLAEIPNQRSGGKTYPAVQYRGNYGTFIVMFDPLTRLPAVVRTRDFDVHAGDSDYDETLSDWREVMASVKMPFKRVFTLNGLKIFDVTIAEIRMNPQLAVDAFTVPVAIRGKAARPAANGSVPHQWIIRRLGNGFYLDSDALYTDEGNNLQLVDVGPNISHLTGGSHNTLIVATNDSLIAFDAPGDDGLSLKAIELAKAKYPGKPFRYVVLTHHHIDHTGGIRAYAAEGATLVVGKGNGAFFRRALAAPQGLNRFPLRSVPPKVIEVDGKWSVTDGGRTIEAYALETTHSEGYLIPYVPDAKMGFITDLWGPGPMVPPANAGMRDVVAGVQKAGITPEKFAGGHGAVGNYADLVKSVQAAPAAPAR